MTGLSFLLLISLLLSSLASLPRWLNVAQREHYSPGRVILFCLLWCSKRPLNLCLLGVILLTVALSSIVPTSIFATAVLLSLWPIGYSARRSRLGLRWTSRIRRLTVASAGILALLVFCLTLSGASLVVSNAVGLVLLPIIVDLAQWFMAPVEAFRSRKFVTAAQRNLIEVDPVIIAITGSYGKTSTKNYAARIMRDWRSVYASPASFNNKLGLARAVNQGLSRGTGVFIAEMGTHGPGEIRELCNLFPPAVAAITSIGEAHLERMRSRATIVAAKTEITERARSVVLNIDEPELMALAATLESSRSVIRCSATESTAADVIVRPNGSLWSIILRGDSRVDIDAPPGAHPTNLAIALGVGLAAGLSCEQALKGVGDLPASAHRAEVSMLETGVTVVDDSFNSNPVGAREAVVLASQLRSQGGHLYVVTPGMVELGHVQKSRNRALASQVREFSQATLFVTKRTNRAALLGDVPREGAYWAASRDRAAREVFASAARGDVVLFENDLPEHYP